MEIVSESRLWRVHIGRLFLHTMRSDTNKTEREAGIEILIWLCIILLFKKLKTISACTVSNYLIFVRAEHRIQIAERTLLASVPFRYYCLWVWDDFTCTIFLDEVSWLVFMRKEMAGWHSGQQLHLQEVLLHIYSWLSGHQVSATQAVPGIHRSGFLMDFMVYKYFDRDKSSSKTLTQYLRKICLI